MVLKLRKGKNFRLWLMFKFKNLLLLLFRVLIIPMAGKCLELNKLKVMFWLVLRRSITYKVISGNTFHILIQEIYPGLART